MPTGKCLHHESCLSEESNSCSWQESGCPLPWGGSRADVSQLCRKGQIETSSHQGGVASGREFLFKGHRGVVGTQVSSPACPSPVMKQACDTGSGVWFSNKLINSRKVCGVMLSNHSKAKDESRVPMTLCHLWHSSPAVHACSAITQQTLHIRA